MTAPLTRLFAPGSVAVIGGGIEQGFAEAREILDGLGVLQGDIANNIEQTYQRVQEGLQAFRAQFSPAGE